MMNTKLARLLCTPLVLLAASCGGGGGGAGGPLIPPAQTLLLTSTASIDAYTSHNIRNSVGELIVGDEESLPGDRGFRSVVSFDISALPAQMDIVSVTLRVYQARIEGQPYTVLGHVLASHVAVGDQIDSVDFDGGLLSEIGTLSTDTGLEYKQLIVSEALTADRTAGRTRTQFRMRFSMADANADGQDTYAGFESGDDTYGTGNLPELLIEYRAQ